jgi:hypothetical protein
MRQSTGRGACRKRGVERADLGAWGAGVVWCLIVRAGVFTPMFTDGSSGLSWAGRSVQQHLTISGHLI